jgi:hypothetical protein
VSQTAVAEACFIFDLTNVTLWISIRCGRTKKTFNHFRVFVYSVFMSERCFALSNVALWVSYLNSPNQSYWNSFVWDSLLCWCQYWLLCLWLIENMLLNVFVIFLYIKLFLCCHCYPSWNIKCLQKLINTLYINTGKTLIAFKYLYSECRTAATYGSTQLNTTEMENVWAHDASSRHVLVIQCRFFVFI